MKVYYHAFRVPTDQLTPLAIRAEQLGFDGCSLSDHVFFPKDSPRFAAQIAYWDARGEHEKGAGAYSPQTEFPDPWVAYAAMAMATERLEFVSSVYVLPLRHPLVVAAAVATAAVLSGNRVAVGAGLGWLDDEYVQLGQEWAHRGSRMTEQIELMRRLWSGECVEFHGRFYDVAGTLHQPPLDPLPPILLGATKTPGYRRTGRIADGFIGGRLAFDEFLAAKAEIERHREEFGRTNEPFIWMNALRHEEAVQPDALRRFAEAGCNWVRVSPFDIDGLAPEHETSLQERLDSLERYAERYLPAAQER